MTPRSIILGLILGAVTVLIVSYAELVTAAIMIGFLQLPPVVVALMFGLVLTNKIVQKYFSGWELKPAEFAVIFVMTLTASMISSRGAMERLPGGMSALNYFASDSNRWEELYFPHTNQSMVPWDTTGKRGQELITDFYEGKDELAPIPWGPWVRPMMIWGGMMALVYAAFMCLASLIYRQWAVHERLNFPLVALPIEMIESGQKGSFWRNPVMWIGFAVPVFVFGLLGLQQIVPEVPAIPVSGNLNNVFGRFPWNQMGYRAWFCSLGAIGLFYLLPTQVLLSLWFFHFLARGQMVGMAALGFTDGGAFVRDQTIGAWVTLAVCWLWIGRGHVKKVFFAALGKKVDDEHEMMPYAISFWGLWICFGGIVWYGCQMGMTVPVAIFMFGVYLFCQVIVMARSTSEGGLPMTEGSFRPSEVYGVFAARDTLDQSNLSAMAWLDQMFARDLRGLLLTGMLDAQKMAEQTGLRKRKLIGIFAIAVVFAFAVAAGVQIWLPYEKGGLNLYPYAYHGHSTLMLNHYAPVMTHGEPYQTSRLIGASTGLAITLALFWLRAAVWWWPLHPLGYALCHTWTLMVFWPPILAAWVIKFLVSRYGGNAGYRKLRPFFLGMIFGEFTMAVFWTLCASIFNSKAPHFPWP
jgi:hypothetical protein